MKYLVSTRGAGTFGWTLQDTTGNALAQSFASFGTVADAIAGIQAFKAIAVQAGIQPPQQNSPPPHYQVYLHGGTGQWAWVLLDATGASVADSFSPFSSYALAAAGINAVKQIATQATIQAPQQQSPPPPPPPPPASPVTTPATLLGQADFQVLGWWDLDTSLSVGWNVVFGQGLTMRYVNGEPRFLTLCYPDTGSALCLLELALPAAFGQPVTQTNRWNDIFAGGPIPNQNDCWYGIRWEESKQRLWTTFGINYPDPPNFGRTDSIQVRELNAEGTISNLQGPWGFAGVSHRCTRGAIVDVPADFQAAYGVGPYAVQGGGDASEAMQGGEVSYGPTLFAFDEPTGQPAGNIPFKTLLDCRGATATPAWYPAASAPTSYDRGVRNIDVLETYDTWTSPAPDGLGRWTWSDSAWQTGVWLKGANKEGFLLLPSLAGGNAFYQDSTLHCDTRLFELQVFDPAALAQVALGKAPPWSVKPANRWEVAFEGFGAGKGGNAPMGDVAATCFDPVTSILYCLGVNVNGTSQGTGKSRLFAIQVKNL